MSVVYHPSEEELLEKAVCGLRQRMSGAASSGAALSGVASADRIDMKRRERSLRTCHRPAVVEREALPFKDDGGYVPETAARLENDPNLTDGARRCARKIMEETYRRNRSGRTLSITVSYLAKGLGRCRRTVQRYLRQLEEAGYIAVSVAASERARWCVGIVVRLCEGLFPGHHKRRWPDKAGKPGATQESQNHRSDILFSREQWAWRCMDGVFRALMKTDPLKRVAEVRAG